MREHYELIIDTLGRPVTHNAETRLNRYAIAKTRKAWRDNACILDRQARIPRLDRVAVTCWGRYPTRVMPSADRHPHPAALTGSGRSMTWAARLLTLTIAMASLLAATVVLMICAARAAG